MGGVPAASALPDHPAHLLSEPADLDSHATTISHVQAHFPTTPLDCKWAGACGEGVGEFLAYSLTLAVRVIWAVASVLRPVEFLARTLMV